MLLHINCHGELFIVLALLKDAPLIGAWAKANFERLKAHVHG